MKNPDRYFEGLTNDLLTESGTEVAPSTYSLKGLKICVIGAGFVGTVTAAGLANFGHDVICVEKDRDRLSMLRSGRLPFYERDLDKLVTSGLSSGLLTFESDLEQSVEGMNVVFLTVGTPSSPDGRTDLTALYDIVSRLSKKMKSNQIFVLKSTVPVGTADSIKLMLRQNGNDSGIAVVNNPEFLREGNAVHDFYNPFRIVVGGDSIEAISIISNIYKLGLKKPVSIFTTDNKTAEMIKYTSNVFLATKIGFINEISRLCDRIGINTAEVARIIGADPRIGPDFLNPGPGWGGSCLPKDLLEFMGLADSMGVSLFIPEAVRSANLSQYDHVVSKVRDLVGDLKGTKIGAFGLTFKANTSDFRESPAIAILSRIVDKGAEIRAYDPEAGDEFSVLFPGINRYGDPYEVAEGADCILVLTEWPDFPLLDWKKISGILGRKNIIDTRNILNPEQLKRFGFRYATI